MSNGSIITIDEMIEGKLSPIKQKNRGTFGSSAVSNSSIDLEWETAEGEDCAWQYKIIKYQIININ